MGNPFIFLLIVLLCSSFAVSAQYEELTFEHFSKEKGLSSSNVTSFAQTPDGLLWVGTRDGLNQFDGYAFKVYRNDHEDSLSIGDNNITTLFVDHAGTLWIGTENGGLARYNREGDNFTNYRHTLYDTRTISSQYITSITEDADQQLWVGTVTGLNRFNPKEQGFTRYFHEIGVQIDAHTLDTLAKLQLPARLLETLSTLANKEFLNEHTFFRALKGTLSASELEHHKLTILRHVRLSTKSDDIKALQADENGNLWIGYAQEGIAYFNPRTSKSKVYRHTPGIGSVTGGSQASTSQGLSSNAILSLSLHNQQLWIGTRDGLLSRLDLATDRFSTYELPQEGHNMEAMLVDSNGTLWIGSDYGLYRYDSTSHEFYIYQHQETNDYSLSATAVKAIFEDRQGNLWVGCGQGGVNLTMVDKPFQHLKHYPESPNSLSKNSVSSVLEDRQGNVWIGYYTMGIDVWDKAKQQLTHYAYNAADPTSLGKGTVFAIFEDREGKIWIGTYEGGLQLFDQESRSFITFKNNPADPTSISGNDVRSIVEDDAGSLWLAIHGKGVNRFDKQSKKVKRYKADYLDWQNTLANDWVHTLYFDKAGNLWAGSVDGLSVLKRSAPNFVTYNKANSGLSHNSVRTMLENPQGIMWVGTENGLNRFDVQTSRFSTFSEKQGLPNSTIHGLLNDKSHNLWISTNNGLARFDPREKEVVTYTVLEGLQGDEFFPGAYHQGKSGAMYFGGPNGLNVFYPEQIRPDTSSVPVRLTGLQLFNKPVAVGDPLLKVPLDQKSSISLRHDQNLVSLQYVGLNFKNPGKIEYAYKLEGFDHDWNYVGSKREATYTNLDAGEYVFKVKAANSDGYWNEHPKVLRITILPPFWRTPAAYGIYVLLAAGLLYLFWRSALAKERLKNKLELQRLEARKTHEMDVLKLNFFTNISHEFRTPLTLMLGPMERLIAENQDLDARQRMDYYQLVNRNTQRLLRLINQLLDISELDAGFMKLSVVRYDVVDFCRNIAEAFVYRAGHLNIAYTFSSNVPKAEVYFDHDKLEKVLYNLISNALKFTPPGGKVSVRLFLEHQGQVQETLVLEVEDTGPGIPQSQQQKIFKRFYQTATHARRKGGTGIGLALSKQLVECHYGTLSVQSAEGVGSMFRVSLPVSGERYTAAETGESRPLIEEKLQELRSVYLEGEEQPDAFAGEEDPKTMSGLPAVLLVEDSAEVRAFIRKNLCREYRIYEAADGTAGYEQALEINPDLIISDVMMPGMDGFELCSTIKSNPQTSHIPLVLLTARSSETYELEGLETGADDYISKPFNMLLFKARIRNILESRQRLKERLSADVSFEPKHIATNSLDQAFMDRLLAVIDTHLADEHFNPDALAAGMNLSRSQLYKKVKGLTGQSVSILVRNIRLRKACALLKSQSMSISEVAYSVGFSDPAYFTKCFKAMYAQSPSEYLHSSS